MDLIELGLIADLKLSSNVNYSLAALIKYYRDNKKSIPKQPSAFILLKSLTNVKYSIHYSILTLLDTELLVSMLPGLISCYLKILNNENIHQIENYICFVLKNTEVIPGDTSIVLYNYFKTRVLILPSVFEILCTCGTDESKLFYCKVLNANEKPYNFEFINEHVLNLINQFSKETGNRSVSNNLINATGSIFIEEIKGSEKKSLENRTNQIREKFEKGLKTGLNNSHNNFNNSNNERKCLEPNNIHNNFDDSIDEIKYWISSLSTNNKLRVEPTLLNFSLEYLGFNILKIIVSQSSYHIHTYIEKTAVESYLDIYMYDNFIELCEDTFKKGEIISNTKELLFIYLTKYNKDIYDTNLGKKIDIKEMIKKHENFYVSLIENRLTSLNISHNRNLLLLRVFVNLIALGYKINIEKMITKIFDIVYILRDEEIAINYLFAVDSLIELKIINRKQLRRVFKEILYLDSDTSGIRSYVYKIMCNIIPDYHEMDTYINKLSITHDSIVSTQISCSRIPAKEFNKLNKHNVTVFAAKLWPDLSETKTPSELHYYVQLLTVILKHTESFYERRIQQDNFLQNLFNLLKRNYDSIYIDLIGHILDLDLSKNNFILIFNFLLCIFSFNRNEVLYLFKKMEGIDKYFFLFCVDEMVDCDSKRRIVIGVYLNDNTGEIINSNGIK